jgi:RNA polymerase sigma-70 factor (ECF subfamily)
LETGKNISQRLYKGDPDAYILIFRKYYANLCVYASQFIKDKSETEEVVQEVFVKLWENRRKVKIGKIENYLYKAVKNNSFNKLAKKNNKLLNDEELLYRAGYSEYNSDVIIEKELIEHIKQAIDLLPKKTKDVFIMSRYNEMKYDEIAKKLNITKKGVEYHISKALRFLNNKLKDFI